MWKLRGVQVIAVKRFDIVRVNLAPKNAVSINKSGIFVVLSWNRLNKNARTLVVAPLSKDGHVDLEKICTLHRRRILANIGVLDKTEIERIVPYLKIN